MKRIGIKKRNRSILIFDEKSRNLKQILQRLDLALIQLENETNIADLLTKGELIGLYIRFKKDLRLLKKIVRVFMKEIAFITENLHHYGFVEDQLQIKFLQYKVKNVKEAVILYNAIQQSNHDFLNYKFLVKLLLGKVDINGINEWRCQIKNLCQVFELLVYATKIKF
jgi:hypothetical protein